MNPIVTEFFRLLAREVAQEVAKQITSPAANDDTPASLKTSETTMHTSLAVERSESEWRADCLSIINLLAPTHGRELRALLAKFDAKRLGEVKADALPSLLAELVLLNDAS